MRTVKGLEKPIVQWTVVAGSVLLAVLLGSATLSMRARNSEIEALVESQRACRADREALEAQLARERAAREAFSLELGRLRARQGSADAANPQSPASQEPPTLTLEPPARRGPVPPEATVAAPARAQAVQVRLILPANVTADKDRLTITARDWATGRTLWSTAQAAPGAVNGRRALIAHVTGEMLPPGSYELIVTPSAPAEAVAVYEVTVGVRS